MESPALPASSQVPEAASDSSQAPLLAPGSEGPMASVNRALLAVRDCMVLRVWDVSVRGDFQVMTQIESLGRVVSLMEASDLVPAGLFAKVVAASLAPDIEAVRRQVVAWAKEDMLAHVSPLTKDYKPVQMGLLRNSVHDAACLLFEFALVSRLYTVMRANASMKDLSRTRRVVRPKFLAPDGSVLSAPDDFRKGDPDVVLARAVAKKKELAVQIAWARRRKILAAKGQLPVRDKPLDPPFSLAAFDRLVARWGSRFDVLERSSGGPDLLDAPGAVPDTASEPPST